MPIDPLVFLIGVTFALTVVYSLSIRHAERRPWLVDLQLVVDALIVSAIGVIVLGYPLFRVLHHDTFALALLGQAGFAGADRGNLLTACVDLIGNLAQERGDPVAQHVVAQRADELHLAAQPGRARPRQAQGAPAAARGGGRGRRPRLPGRCGGARHAGSATGGRRPIVDCRQTRMSATPYPGPFSPDSPAQRLPWILLIAILLVRPAAMLLSLLRTSLPARERSVAAWFGPKGFASVVYGLLAVQAGIPSGDHVFDLVAVTIALSIVLHSSTDVLVARAFDDDGRAAVAHAEALAGNAADEGFAAGRAVERDVADDDVLLGGEGGCLRRKDRQTSARQSFSKIIVRLTL